MARLRVLALDQATYISGYSIFDGNSLIESGIFEAVSDNSMERVAKLKSWLKLMIKKWKPDVVALEDIHLSRPGDSFSVGVQTFKILAQLQGVLMNLLYEEGIEFILVFPGVWRSHCGVKGKTKSDLKRSMIEVAKKKFDVEVTNDEAEAIGIGLFAANNYQKIK